MSISQRFQSNLTNKHLFAIYYIFGWVHFLEIQTPIRFIIDIFDIIIIICMRVIVYSSAFLRSGCHFAVWQAIAVR